MFSALFLRKMRSFSYACWLFHGVSNGVRVADMDAFSRLGVDPEERIVKLRNIHLE